MPRLEQVWTVLLLRCTLFVESYRFVALTNKNFSFELFVLLPFWPHLDRKGQRIRESLRGVQDCPIINEAYLGKTQYFTYNSSEERILWIFAAQQGPTQQRFPQAQACFYGANTNQAANMEGFGIPMSTNMAEHDLDSGPFCIRLWHGSVLRTDHRPNRWRKVRAQMDEHLAWYWVWV